MKEEIKRLIRCGYIPIANPEDLINLRNNEEQTFAKGTDYEDVFLSGLDKFYIQVKDIDMMDIDFTPIGTPEALFKGKFDGSVYDIVNLKITGIDNMVGLFGVCGLSLLKNISLYNVLIRGNHELGGLVGVAVNHTKVDKCFVEGIIEGMDDVGGIVGDLSSTSIIENSRSNVKLSSGVSAGGITGNAYNSHIKDCYSRGSISSVVGGGLIGTSKIMEVDDSSSDMDISSRTAGGLTGYSTESKFENCSSNGKLVGEYLGGFFGVANNTEINISTCDFNDIGHEGSVNIEEVRIDNKNKTNRINDSYCI